MKQKFMEKDGVRTEVADNGSVEAMEEAGWKVVGNAPDQKAPEGASEGSARLSSLPKFMRTATFLEATMGTLPESIEDPDGMIKELHEVFGGLVTEEHEKFVRSRGPKDLDLGDNTDVDPKYHAVPVSQVRDLLDAKGLKYSADATKAEMVNTLIESGKPKKK